jgi:hypothetical protein
MALLGLPDKLSARAIQAAVQAAEPRFSICVEDDLDSCQPRAISSKLHLKRKSIAFQLRVEQNVRLDDGDTPGFAINGVENDGATNLSCVISQCESHTGQTIERTAPYAKPSHFARLSHEWGGAKTKATTDDDGDLLHNPPSVIRDFVAL